MSCVNSQHSLSLLCPRHGMLQRVLLTGHTAWYGCSMSKYPSRLRSMAPGSLNSATSDIDATLDRELLLTQTKRNHNGHMSKRLDLKSLPAEPVDFVIAPVLAYLRPNHPCAAPPRSRSSNIYREPYWQMISDPKVVTGTVSTAKATCEASPN